MEMYTRCHPHKHMDLLPKPRNVHRHRCTGLTYLPKVGERGYLGSKAVWGDIYEGRPHAPPKLELLSISGSRGRRERVFSFGFG